MSNGSAILPRSTRTAATGKPRASQPTPAPRTPHAGSAAWGWLPPLCLSLGAALFVLALAGVAGRANAPFADALFWVGLIALVAPVGWRLCMSTPAEGERVTLLLLLGMALFAVKLLSYPTRFASFDEFLHWRTAQDIAASGHLYAPNTLLPVSPLYPGLEIITSALSALSGLSLFASGMLVLAVGRLLLVGGLYLFYRRIGGSARVASLAMLLYMTNPHFLLFESQFAYESLALPLGACALWLVARSAGASHLGERLRFGLLALPVVAALAETHHITSYAIFAFLALWAGVALFRPGSGLSYLTRLLLAAAIGVLTVSGVAWLLISHNPVVGYLAPHIAAALAELGSLATMHSLPAHPFADFAGNATPAWETFAGIAAVLLATAGILYALRTLRRGERPSAAVLALAMVALAYPLSQIFRLSPDGTEIADRLPDFLFVAVAYLLARIVPTLPQPRPAPSRTRRSPHRTRRVLPAAYGRPALLTAALLVLFLGGVCIGDGPEWMRLPGPTLVEADMRSIDAEHIALATWMADALGAGHVVAADRDTRLLLATYGRQNPVTGLVSAVDTSRIFTAATLTPATLATLRAAHVQCLVVDLRLSTALPAVGLYFEQGEPGAYTHTTPLSRAALAKFDGVPGINRIFDDGELQVYDTSALLTTR